MYTKKELGGKEVREIQNIGIEYSEWNAIADQRQVMKRNESCFTEQHDRSNGTEHLNVEPKGSRCRQERSLYFTQ